MSCVLADRLAVYLRVGEHTVPGDVVLVPRRDLKRSADNVRRLESAAAAVVQARRHGETWEELKTAIGELEEALLAIEDAP